MIVANAPELLLLPLAERCWEKGVPLIALRSCGFIGTVRLQLKNHEIVESKLETDQWDLRISKPFPELEQFCSGIDLDVEDSLQHGHIPYIAILYQAIQKWRQQVILSLQCVYVVKHLQLLVVQTNT